MSNYNWGYKNAASMAKELAGGGKVSVKPHTRAPRSPTPQGYAKGGPVKNPAYTKADQDAFYSAVKAEKSFRSAYGPKANREVTTTETSVAAQRPIRKSKGEPEMGKATQDTYDRSERAVKSAKKLLDGYAKGGPVKHSDAKQDKAMMARHNKLMHPGQKSKLSAGGPAKKNWIKGAIKNPGALHRDLGVPQGQKIPAKKLTAAAKKPGVVGRRARLAQTLKKMK